METTRFTAETEDGGGGGVEKRLVLLRKRTTVLLFKDLVIFNSRRRVGRVESSRCLRSDSPAIITSISKAERIRNTERARTCVANSRRI